MTTAFESLTSHLNSMGMRFGSDEDAQTLFFGIGGKLMDLQMVFRVEKIRIEVVAKPPLKVPQGAASQVLDLVNRINCRLTLGKICFEPTEGAIFFHLSHFITSEEESIGGDVLNALLATPCYTWDTFLTAFLACIYANETPEDALRQIQAGRAA